MSFTVGMCADELHDHDHGAATGLSVLERRILTAKGLTEEHLAALAEVGVADRASFSTIGDAGTLCQLLPGLSGEVAADVMAWALGGAGSGGTAGPGVGGPGTASGGAGTGAGAGTGGFGGTVVIESADTVNCVHCGTRQPKDYSPGDLCPACGKQAEPILSCFWCGSSGPGQYCRQCGAKFVPTAELDLAILLKREGLPKEQIPARLDAMDAAEKDVLWGRVRKARG